jgi:NADH-quinone oxidoreductase subunit I
MSGYKRSDMVNDKDRLLEMGGALPDAHYKWDKKKTAEEAAAHAEH